MLTGLRVLEDSARKIHRSAFLAFRSRWETPNVSMFQVALTDAAAFGIPHNPSSKEIRVNLTHHEKIMEEEVQVNATEAASAASQTSAAATAAATDAATAAAPGAVEPGVISGPVTSDSNVVDRIVETVAQYGLNIIAAIVILVVGLWLAKKVKTLFVAALNKKEIDPTLVGFFAGLLHGAVVIFVAIAAISKLGVQTTSFIAVVGAAGLAVGLALQGSLSNFASGVLLIMFKPFVAGNFIKVGGELGSVVQVGILTTELNSPDNVRIIMPNSAIMNSPITNFSYNDTRRVDMVFGVGYGDDLNKAKQILEDLIAADERVLQEPAPVVAVSNLGDSSVDFVVRPWTKASDYWPFKFDFTKAAKEKFDQEGISIPFPQRDVHLFEEKSS
jgi:small conductance mechanosensitive channel